MVHQFDSDFYGETLRLIIIGYIRAESNFPSLDALIEAIQTDISVAKQDLARAENEQFVHHPFLASGDDSIFAAKA